MMRADNYFAIVPEWVLDAEISAQAVRLYCVLNRHADKAGQCHPSRKSIADRMQVSTATVDRAMDELVKIGAVVVTHRKIDGSQEWTSNAYTIITARPSAVTRGLLTDDETYPASDETGLLTGDEQNRASVKQSQETEKTLTPATVVAAASSDEFAAFWQTYPRKIGKGAAQRRWARMSAQQRAAAIDALPDHVEHWQRTRTETRFVPHPATWLNAERWADDLVTDQPTPSAPSAVLHAADLYRRAVEAEQADDMIEIDEWSDDADF